MADRGLGTVRTRISMLKNAPIVMANLPPNI